MCVLYGQHPGQSKSVNPRSGYPAVDSNLALERSKHGLSLNFVGKVSHFVKVVCIRTQAMNDIDGHFRESLDIKIGKGKRVPKS